VLKARQKLGKYRIEKRLANGPLAAVYRAYDTIHGMRVALKIPHRRIMDEYFLADFRKEVRLSAKLDHPNILPIQNADFVGSYFVISMPLGDETLGDRLTRRIATPKALDFADQILAAVAHAHSKKIIHCDIKPEHFILFGPYVAPEQAMGRPMLQSDVFSVGLVLYRLFAGALPKWPYEWPPAGYRRLQQKLHPDMVALIRRAIEVPPTRRYRDAMQMYSAFQRLRRRALR
jgi:serine/threonine protein kinase